LLTIYLDNDIYEILSELLTVQDFLLLTYGLECLYQLSQFNEIVCNQLILTSKSILCKILISLSQSLIFIFSFIALLISYLTIDSTYLNTNSMKMIEIKQSTNKMQPTIVQYSQPNNNNNHTKIIQQNQMTYQNSNYLFKLNIY
jgi:hypothetical protein